MNEAYNLFDKITDILESWDVQAEEGKLQIGEVLIQWGSATATSSEMSDVYWGIRKNVTFPQAFRAGAAVYVWIQDNLGGDYLSTNTPSSITVTGFQWRNVNERLKETTIGMSWLAIGLTPN